MKSFNTHNSGKVNDRLQMTSKTIPLDTQEALGFYVEALREPRALNLIEPNAN